MGNVGHIERYKVRDYECDLQGVVNNAVYQNYLEHARHEYLQSLGVNFAALAAAGVNLVVVRVELDYRSPLRPGDEFVVATRMERESRVRFAFFQDIIRSSDHKIILNGKIVGTALNERGRPQIPEELSKAVSGMEEP
jgi:acyl-CoA thioester hydrolase